MSPEQATALIVAITGLVVALGTVYGQLRGLRRDVRSHHATVDGRMVELLTLSQLAAEKQGELAGRDFATRSGAQSPSSSSSS